MLTGDLNYSYYSFLIRYGEQNPCFSVATFSSDEEDKDVAKKVTSALERVTSDYHSGSSSDEESTRASPLTITSSRCTFKVLCNTLHNSHDINFSNSSMIVARNVM